MFHTIGQSSNQARKPKSIRGVPYKPNTGLGLLDGLFIAAGVFALYEIGKSVKGAVVDYIKQYITYTWSDVSVKITGGNAVFAFNLNITNGHNVSVELTDMNAILKYGTHDIGTITLPPAAVFILQPNTLKVIPITITKSIVEAALTLSDIVITKRYIGDLSIVGTVTSSVGVLDISKTVKLNQYT